MYSAIAQRWEFHTKGGALLLISLIICALVLCTGSVPSVVSAVLIYCWAIAHFSLWKWYLKDTGTLLFKNFCLSVIVSIVIGFTDFFLNDNSGLWSVMLIPFIMSAVYFVWILVARFWIHRQFQPICTMTVKISGNDNELEIDDGTMEKWIKGWCI